MCEVMGIVNVTPDSFSDGGKFFRPEEAIKRARNLFEEGAKVVDIGGESTRPGSTPISWAEEWERLKPVITADSNIRKFDNSKISVDTYHPETAQKALEAGVKTINCVYSGPIPEMAELCLKFGAELILPVAALENLPKNEKLKYYIDPMIGFGTTREEDIRLLRSIPDLAKRARVVIGASRKRIVKRLVGEKTLGKDLAANLAIAIYAALNGATLVRVHDVRETVQSLRVLQSLCWHLTPEI